MASVKLFMSEVLQRNEVISLVLAHPPLRGLYQHTWKRTTLFSQCLVAQLDGLVQETRNSGALAME